MRVLATVLIAFLGPASLLASGRTEVDILRARSTEQERQIRTLETEIESLHSQLALERRRSRGIELSAPSIAAPAKRVSYTVRTGDTLSSIARRYHTSAEGLMKNNGIADPTRLRVGQKLILPSDAKVLRKDPPPHPPKVEPKKTTPKATPKPPANSHDYQVQRGDTLYGIARRHQISIEILKKLNPKIDDKIVTGQTINVTGQAKKVTLMTTNQKTIATVNSKVLSKEQKKTPKTSESKTTPKPETVVEDSGKTIVIPPTPKSISTIMVMEEISFGNFAKNHGTTPDQLNSLNGWRFKPSLVLARGSEIYVPVP